MLCDALAGLTHFPPIHEAPVWTTASIFRETRAEARDYGHQGMVAVEMESASLFAAAQKLNISAASILVISDSLAHGAHQVAPKMRKVNHQLFSIARLLLRLFKK